MSGIRSQLLSLFIATPALAGGLTQVDDGKSLTILDNDQKVLTLNYAFIPPPKGFESTLNEKELENLKKLSPRCSYVDPMYGLDGDRLTEDYPLDHLHHRGLFWAWPKTRIGDRVIDLWALAGSHPVFEKWMDLGSEKDSRKIGMQTAWVFDDDPTPQVRENVILTIHPADEIGRSIDFEIKLTNVAKEDLVLRGSDADAKETGTQKGYGGFTLRHDGKRTNIQITSALGVVPGDTFLQESPWADISSEITPGGPKSGLAVFQHTSHPDYPFKGWILRHYGMIGCAWPGWNEVTLKPGEALDLTYRVYVHRGDAVEGKVAERFAEYLAGRP